MDCHIYNNSDMNIDRILPVLKLFLPYAQEKMGFNKPVDIEFISDKNNANKLLGKTAYYDPDKKRVCVFVDKRHPKDMLKSIAHELAHHTQNCRGDLDLTNPTTPGYAQQDKHMRKMEDEAYKTLLLFRDFEDTHRHLIETHVKGEIKMSYKNWRDQEMFDRLMDNYGYKKSELQTLNEATDVTTGYKPAKPHDGGTYSGHFKKDSIEEDEEDSGDTEAGEHYEINAEDDEDHIDAIRRHLDALEQDRDDDEEHVEETVSSRAIPGSRKAKEDTNLRPMEENILRRAIREALIQKLKKSPS